MYGIQQLLALIIFLTAFLMLSCMGFWEKTPSAFNPVLSGRQAVKTERGGERRAPTCSCDHLRKVWSGHRRDRVSVLERSVPLPMRHAGRVG